jgi:NAD+ kinase
MNKPFKKIALVARSSRPHNPDDLRSIVDFLLQLKVELVLESETANIIADLNAEHLPASKLKENGVELIIVVGGDGSMLHASKIAVAYDIPVVGINRGRLGFLTEINPDDLAPLNEIFAGNYTVEERVLLAVETYLGDKLLEKCNALNDAVLMPGASAHLLDFDIFVDDCLVCHQRADGLIVATPTGSTAYSLSAGGPIMSPKLGAIVMVPMLPHKLSSRPIVINSDSKIKIIIDSLDDTSPCLSCDGMESLTLPQQACINIAALPKKLKLIHSTSYNYFNTLRVKLGWETK